MAWDKSPPDLITLFDAAVPPDPVIERRQMFGYPCAFVNGNMFVGLHEDNLILRLSEADRNDLIEATGTRLFEPFPGRVMREYAVVPPEMRTDAAALGAWIERSLTYVSALPPKVKKPRKTKAKA